MSSTFEQFVADIVDVMSVLDTKLQRDLTMRTRVSRRYSIAEAAEFLSVDKVYLRRVATEDPDFPAGIKQGRERTLSPAEIMKIRCLLASKPGAKRQHLWWREPNEPVKVVTFGAQKGGVGKSLAAAHFAQYLNLHYGLRVGLIDADPQATLSLYFADEKLPLFSSDTPTMAHLMGVEEVGLPAPAERTPKELDDLWFSTPWPGIRLLPGGANIQNADMALFTMARGGQVPIYRILKDAIQKWDAGNQPKTVATDMRDPESGRFLNDVMTSALHETFDVIVIDQQPALTLTQLNGLIAADTAVIPQTLKGFDLATLSTYVGSIQDYLDVVLQFDETLGKEKGGHVVLPSIVQESNDQDLNQVIDLLQRAPEHVSKVFYTRSDAVANASESYMSIYEYTPPPSRKKSAASFTLNANCVNDSLVRRALPHLPPKDFEEIFIERYYDAN